MAISNLKCLRVNDWVSVFNDPKKGSFYRPTSTVDKLGVLLHYCQRDYLTWASSHGRSINHCVMVSYSLFKFPKWVLVFNQIHGNDNSKIDSHCIHLQIIYLSFNHNRSNHMCWAYMWVKNNLSSTIKIYHKNTWLI
jgi:hypothetical protein